MKRAAFLILAWICTATAIVGVFVPVLPTTPLLLLATFLFAKSSPRCHAWLQGTALYKRYVLPFKERGGLPLGQKLRIVAVSFVILGISALSVRIIYIWIILALVALWLLYLMIIHIPTVPAQAPPSPRQGTKSPGDRR
ncbi:MAG: YbaN family protein [Coriobacteriales bacterium]|jgi:uncharacterized membrane protein YbaN (DUF454 family)|nr:YbaN family protein [Coriobacteriales bacterium]